MINISQTWLIPTNWPRTDAQQEYEYEMSRFAAACMGMGTRISFFLTEVDHREQVFSQAQQETPRSISGFATPRAAALHSVTEDIITGRLV